MGEITMASALARVAAAFPGASEAQTSIVWREKLERDGMSAQDVARALDALMEEVSIKRFDHRGVERPWAKDEVMPRLYALAREAKGRRVEDERRITDTSRILPATGARDPLMAQAGQLAAGWVVRCFAEGRGREATEERCSARISATYDVLVMAREQGVTVVPAALPAFVEGALAARAIERWLRACVAERRAA